MNHEIYMQRCLELAAKGLRQAMPNPSVGAVLVYNNRIIGEGHTSPYGGAHGEVNCVNSVKKEDKHLIDKATLYVSLEPCSHYGKTPPCCDLIIQQRIPKIVIGTTDPHEKVAGRGIKKLQEAGKEVITGVLEKECRELNKRFFTFHEKKRPYIILKWAESADGFLSPEPTPNTEKRPVWITNKYSRQLVHKWRSEEIAILVGTQTVIDDNPQLDVRSWTGTNPTRIVLDRQNRIGNEYAVKNLKTKSIILTEQSDFHNLDNLEYEVISFQENLAKKITDVLYKHNLQSVIIEGGRQTLQTFIDAELWDEARVFKGKNIFKKGTPAPSLAELPENKVSILNDELLIFRRYGKDDTI